MAEEEPTDPLIEGDEETDEDPDQGAPADLIDVPPIAPDGLPRYAELDAAHPTEWPRQGNGKILVVHDARPPTKGPLVLWWEAHRGATTRSKLIRCARRTWVLQGDGVWEWWQCGSIAASGFTVCRRHGANKQREGVILDRLVENAGSVVKEGTDNHPLAEVARAQNRSKLLKRDPELYEMWQGYMRDEGLLDFRPQIALGKALLQRYMEISNLMAPDEVVGIGTLLEAPALRAIGALERVVDMGLKWLNYERKLGAISHADMMRFLRSLRRAVARYVAKDKVDDFYRTLREDDASVVVDVSFESPTKGG